MTPEQFIAKWRANARMERAACQEHFIDLCGLLGEPTPNSDPDGATYAFEKGLTKAVGGDGWADVWRRDCFAWEYKGKHRDLDAAYRQLLNYAPALGNPPLLVVCDIARIIVRTHWTNAISERHEVLLDELTDPARLHLLKAVFADPDRLRPVKTREALTRQAAAEFAEMATRLRARGNDPHAVAHFINRLVFCLFADDVGLLPAGLLADMLAGSRRNPARFAPFARELFAAMASQNGRIGFTPVPWFNGGLFDDDSALALEKDDIESLERIAELDWAEIDPSIMGTLFERGLDPGKRSQLGAHYTDRDKIEMLIDPVIRRPLLAEWAEVKARIEAVLVGAPPARRGRPDRRVGEAAKLLRAFLDRLRGFRVLDPACGSGNFLYLALHALKDIEHLVSVEAEALGLQREFPQVGPECVLGIEINDYAAELARVSVWIGHIQWMRRRGLPMPSDPVLRVLDTIECRDAVLAEDGTRATWPKPDVIVGNPPFLGGRRMRSVLDDDYCERLFAAYDGRVPAEADLVCYWLELAREMVASGNVARAGLVATNSVRGGANRRVLDAIVRSCGLFEAFSDEAWTVEGAAVRVSLICLEGKSEAGVAHLDGREVAAIHADLTGVAGLDLTLARRLTENLGVAFMGDTKGGAFDIPGELARKWLRLPTNANGRPNADVLRPWANGMDVTRRPSDTWIIDFGWRMSEAEAAYYAEPFAYVAEHVKPTRSLNNREAYRLAWWRHVEPRPGMWRLIGPLQRFIVTPEVSKHRVFHWLTYPTIPDHKLQVIGRDDDRSFGILQSRVHVLWATGVGSWHGVGNDPRYTIGTCFHTFPFPPGLTDFQADPIAAAARALVEARDRWLNPPELVKRVPEIVPGFPDRILPVDEKAGAILRTRTLTNLYNTRGTPAGRWLDDLHRALDAAVAAAYGWPADLSDEAVLGRLLALNLERAASAATLPPTPSRKGRGDSL